MTIFIINLSFIFHEQISKNSINQQKYKLIQLFSMYYILYNIKQLNKVKMVKGFDTSLTDPSKIFLDYLLNFFNINNTNLSPQKANYLIRYWIKNSKNTSWVYRQFQNILIKPKIIIRKNCSKPLYSAVPYEGDNYFGAYGNQQQVHICLNNIRNKIELKQNVDRQLYAIYYNQIKNKQKQNQVVKDTKQLDRYLIQNLYESCMQGYKNYDWQLNTQKRVSKKCAVYLFRRRTTSNLPPDSLFRYASRLAQQYCI